MQGFFPDGKTFPDASAARGLDEIYELYLQQQGDSNFDLKNFLDQHFTPPEDVASGFLSNIDQGVVRHIEALWDVLTRESINQDMSIIPLPHPYIVPGGRFREVYYWDSYFTMLGLRESGRIGMISNMVENFSYLLDEYGHIPNGNRSYYLGRSQPPFYSLMVQLLAELKGADVLIDHLPSLLKEYNWWMHTKRAVTLPNGEIMNRYWDEASTPRAESYREDVELAQRSGRPPEEVYLNLRAAAESGWDFSSRWFKGSFETIRTTELIPVDLNCLLLNLENTIATTYELLQRQDDAVKFHALASARAEAIRKYCWNEADGFYFDYDLVAHQPSKCRTLAAVYPLFFKIAGDAKADAVAAQLEEHFLRPGGLTTTLDHTGQQWDAPNGWAPLQWMAFVGLMNYEKTALADELRERWLAVNNRVFERSGKLTEKYDVFNQDLDAAGGEYPLQDGFGWTNGVYLAMSNYKKNPATFGSGTV